MIPALSIVVLAGIILLLVHENRRLTNLLLSKNPAVAIAAEKSRKPSKPQEKVSGTRTTWNEPIEAVGP
jgi:hypothetical protein